MSKATLICNKTIENSSQHLTRIISMQLDPSWQVGKLINVDGFWYEIRGVDEDTTNDLITYSATDGGVDQETLQQSAETSGIS